MEKSSGSFEVEKDLIEKARIRSMMRRGIENGEAADPQRAHPDIGGSSGETEERARKKHLLKVKTG